MAESPQRVDLRLTVPASVVYAGLAGDIAARFAEYRGASKETAARLAKAVDAIVSRARGASAESVTFEVTTSEDQLTVQADAAGRKEQTSCPIDASL
jgi:hypothetical protein